MPLLLHMASSPSTFHLWLIEKLHNFKWNPNSSTSNVVKNCDVTFKPKIIKSYLKKEVYGSWLPCKKSRKKKEWSLGLRARACASITFNQRKTSFSHTAEAFWKHGHFLCRQIGADSRGQKEHQIHGKKWWNGSLNAEELSVSSRMLALGKLFEWLISKYIM